MNKQIGADLHPSEARIKVHRGQIMRKKEADSLPELVRMGRPSRHLLRGMACRNERRGQRDEGSGPSPLARACRDQRALSFRLPTE